MAELRYQWGEHPPQAEPWPPKAATLTLLVGACEAWTGDVSEELWAFARWCALAVAPLWNVPDTVRYYLKTGDAGLRRIAHEAARTYGGYTAAWDPLYMSAFHASAAASEAAPWYEDQDAASATQAAAIRASKAVEDIARAAARAERDSAYYIRIDAAKDAAQAAQVVQLRMLLLRRTLPEAARV